ASITPRWRSASRAFATRPRPRRSPRRLSARSPGGSASARLAGDPDDVPAADPPDPVERSRVVEQVGPAREHRRDRSVRDVEDPDPRPVLLEPGLVHQTADLTVRADADERPRVDGRPRAASGEDAHDLPALARAP